MFTFPESPGKLRTLLSPRLTRSFLIDFRQLLSKPERVFKQHYTKCPAVIRAH